MPFTQETSVRNRTLTSAHYEYLDRKLRESDATWKICVWHMTMAQMQEGPNIMPSTSSHASYTLVYFCKWRHMTWRAVFVGPLYVGVLQGRLHRMGRV